MISRSERRESAQSIPQTALMLWFVFFLSFGKAGAQQQSIRQLLPEDPGALVAQQQDKSSRPGVVGTATVSGTVLDSSGAAIPDAHVKLLDKSGEPLREVRSGSDGTYSIENLSAGTYKLAITSAGFALYNSDSFDLSAAQLYAVPRVTLAIAVASTEVQVLANDSKVAEAQMKAAEQQRVLGFVPNFYTSFVHDAVPLTSREKYRFALRETFDPSRFVGTGIGAAIQHANNTYPGYGDDAAGYGKRYAALYGDGLFSDILSHAIFPSIFHQDPRYFYQGTGTIKSRFFHAVSFAVLIRSDSGRTVPNYSYLLGDLGAGAIDNLYYPHADRGPGLVFTNAAIGIGGRAAGSLAREFLLPRLTTHKAGKGKP